MSFLKSVTHFIKMSYPPKVRRVLLWSLVLIIPFVYLISLDQKSNADEEAKQRIAGIQAEQQARENQSEEICIQNCRQKYSTPYKNPYNPDFKGVSQISCEMGCSKSFYKGYYEQQLTALEKTLNKDLATYFFDDNLKTGLYAYLILFLAFPALRLLRVTLRSIRLKATSIYAESGKMSSFQKYSLILSTLILIAFITLVIVMIILFW